MEGQVEQWQLRSGTWLRHPASESWRMATTADGTEVSPRLSAQDLARLIGASREPASGEWFPPEISYSPQTGAPLRVTIPTLDFSWVPPFGAPSLLPRLSQIVGGLRLTPRALALDRANERAADARPDRSLPALPQGQYRFVVDGFGLACPTLVAVEPERGDLHVLLPESNSWTALERRTSGNWGQRLRNPRGWRMELVHAHGQAIAYCPSATGLALITPNAIGLCYAIEHVGEGAAIGGPVAWRGAIWGAVQGMGDSVQLVGKQHGASGHTALPTRAPVPQHGFEAPVFDDLHVNWPCAEGQLVLRLDAHGSRLCDWIAWPERLEPVFEMGWPYRSPDGTFWQLCVTQNGRFEYVQMARSAPEAAPVDALHLCTGRACYRGTLRIDGEPWRTADAMDHPSTQIVAPMLESARDGAVVGLRMDAPQGVLALLHGSNELRRGVLQVEVQGQHVVPFGTVDVNRPWLTQLFVHDGHLWVSHPDLPQAVGWKLAP
ncbi:hypothetical protein ACPWT1_21300 [Ramlibacter sp. MMS24-I3-19]|uniref:hypothetical protein n=1 Tax=Ramlibacter sp. MMS24-I3-19 TaxID=3416606 RepID=UPI003CFC002B